jgi:hypothetical protein
VHPASASGSKRRTATATRPGEISLRGLHPLVVAPLLLGLQEHTRTGRKHFDGHLRYAVNDIRRQQVASLSEVDTARMNSKAQQSLVRTRRRRRTRTSGT